MLLKYSELFYKIIRRKIKFGIAKKQKRFSIRIGRSEISNRSIIQNMEVYFRIDY
jgi:hypothetical protein